MNDYYIAFRAGVIPGQAITMKVSIGNEMIDRADNNRTFNLALFDDPLYPQLVEYVRNNPPSKNPQ